jgi:hypothetical protein
MAKSKFISFLFLVILFSSCSEDGSEFVIEFPEVITTPVLEVTVNNVVIGGVVVSDGGGTIIKKGIVWSTSEKLTLNDSIKYDQSSKEEYKLEVTGLKPNTTYYFAAFAENVRGTAFGEIIVVKTSGSLPGPPSPPMS